MSTLTADDDRPRLVGLDWGTSSLRAYLFDGRGRLRERRDRPWGIQRLPDGGYAAAFRAIVGDWRQRWPDLPVLASGMVGSRQGWREVPYVPCPAGPEDVAAGLLSFSSECGLLHVAPGLLQSGPVPDVMRGEEVQIVGAIAVDPALAQDAMLVLPGTHCKWATVGGGRITGFTTYLTGELFALLRDHSILGRPARDTGGTPSRPPEGDAAFLRGLHVARDASAEGVAGRLFTVRSLFLCGVLPAEQTLDYLSGLLVGEEIRSVLAARPDAARVPLVLLGDESLCRRYRAALDAFGFGRVRAFDETGPAGLWRIAALAGLVDASTA